jgi:anti-anti-sigma factor
MLPSMSLLNGVPVARLPADVDAANADAVGELLSAGVAHDASCLILDLGDTRYLDSAGIDMLLRLQERLRGRRQTLELVVPQHSPIRRLLAVMGIDRSLRVHADVAAAAAHGV